MPKVELENPIIRDWPHYPKYHFPASYIKMCECGTQQAKYWVEGEAHCQTCMLDAVDTSEYVRVKKI